MDPLPNAIEKARDNAPYHDDDASALALAGALSGNSLRAYRADLREFTARFCALDAASVRDVLAYRDDLLRAGRSAATVARKLSTLRSAFGRLFAAGMISANPADPRLVRSPRVGTSSTTPNVSPAEVRTLLEATASAGRRSLRDRAILGLLAYCGLRRAEVVSLCLRSVVVEEGIPRLLVTGKGGKVRRISLRSELLADLNAYLATRELGPVPSTGETVNRPLFNLTADAIWRLVKATAARAKVQTPIRPHSFRRAAIQSAIDHGASLRAARTSPAIRTPRQPPDTTENGAVRVSVPASLSRTE